MHRHERSLNRLFAVGLCFCFALGSLIVSGCAQGGTQSSPSPLPTLTTGAASPTMKGQMQAGVGHDRSVHFRTAAGQGLSIRILKAAWHESVLASDGTTHDNVLAVVVQVSVAGPSTEVALGIPAQLEIGNGTSRRSGRFPIEGALNLSEFQPDEVRQGWIAFENVDWDALRGRSSPTEARLRMFAYLGEGIGTGEWMVNTGSAEDGATRRVTLPALGASVDYNIL